MSDKPKKSNKIKDNENTVEAGSRNINAVIPSKLSFPSSAGLVVVTQRPLFPNMIVPLLIEGNLFAKTVQDALQKKPPYIVVVLGKDSFDLENFDRKDIFEVGVLARIVKSFSSQEQLVQILLDVVTRVKIKNVNLKNQKIVADIEILEEQPITDADTIKAYCRHILSSIRELVRINPIVKEELSQFINQVNIEDPHRLADFAAALTSSGRYELQDILESLPIQKRLEKTLLLVKKEVDLGRIQVKISHKIDERLSKNQRDFFLKEQLKEIQKELGLSKDAKSQEIDKFVKRAKKLKWDKKIASVFQEEINKLTLLDTNSPEFNVTRSYLDWLTVLPWNVFQKENQSLDQARKILEEDHYGLEDVKEHILNMLASMLLRKGTSGKILCLLGPPGVGKTSVGKSIARALNRPFSRFSLGGMRDEAEIKGHRRTYIGSMPGKLLQSLKKTAKANSVILLDEIDKVGKSYNGDPASALLEVLDKEQNSQFLDHYLDLPFDLSKILFICTANQIDTIPEALRDRMDIIRIAGYISSEKLEIAKRYLVNKQKIEAGLKQKRVSFTDKALINIINDYARGAGVRTLEKLIGKVLSTVARKFLENEIKLPLVIDEKDIKTYLKSPTYVEEEILNEGTPGSVNGLAWTSYGGAILNIESTCIESDKRGFKQTGQLGKVMIESSEIAYSYILANAKLFEIDPKIFKDYLIHLHVPAGAIPKDGPSAGIAMALAIVSLMKNKPVKKKIGMTGEISLTGVVLPIGGLKEKLIAAQRIGLKEIIIPKQNQRDFEEVPELIKKGLNFTFVTNFVEVYKFCL